VQKRKLQYLALFTIIGLTLIFGMNYFFNNISFAESFTINGREITLVHNSCNSISVSYSPQTDVIYTHVLKITDEDLQELPKLKDLLDVLESRFPVSPSSPYPADDNGLTPQEIKEYPIWFESKSDRLPTYNIISYKGHFYYFYFQQCE